MQETSVLINPVDLYLSHLSLQLCITCIDRFTDIDNGAGTGAGDASTSTSESKSTPAFGDILKKHVYSNALSLAASPLTQGLSQQTTVRFFQRLVNAAAAAAAATTATATFGSSISSINSINAANLGFAGVFEDLYIKSAELVRSDGT